MKAQPPSLSAFIRESIEIYGDELALPLMDLHPVEVPVSESMEVPVSESMEVPVSESVKVPVSESVEESWSHCGSLAELEENISVCQKCSLATSRKKFVFGSGKQNAHIVLVGEAPGAKEDEVGKPFVGEAGQLLDKILAAIQLERDDVFICNVLKCRPPSNRDPLPAEIDSCLPYLEKQLALINPAFILCLGRHAAQTLLRTQAPLSSMRGKVHSWRGIQLIVTYHPAALLRYPQFKRETWADVQLLRRLYDQFLQEHHTS